MKITILGSGTDASAIPGIPNRFPPGYVVEWEGGKILLECSEGIRFRLEQAGFDYTDFSHLAVSHSHPDHYALPQFYQSVHNSLQWRIGQESRIQTINVFCGKQIANEFWPLWQFHQPSWPDGLLHAKLNFVILPEAGEIGIGKAKLLGLPVVHGFGKVQALAFRIEHAGGVFAYSGDTGLCEGIKAVAKAADVFISEASARVGDQAAALNYGHLSPYDSGLIAKEAGVKKLILVHYTGLDSSSAMIDDCRGAGYTGEIVIGQDFQVFEI